MASGWNLPSFLAARLNRRRLVEAGGAVAAIAGGIAPASRGSVSASAHDTGTPEEATMTYEIEGRLLEVCTCNILCPCWVGDVPDGGTCDSVFGWAVDKGIVEGVEVSGRVVALSVHIPGNVLDGNWSAVVYIDDQASQAQEDALLKVFTGQLGGAIADVAALISNVIAVERAPITFAVEGGEGSMTVGDIAELRLAPFVGMTGEPTTLQDTAFSTIPGSPAYVGKAETFRRTEAAHGLSDIDISGHNAIQGTFRFAA